MDISDLPDEILQKIFSYIEQKQDIFNIIRVCQRFHDNLRHGLTTINGIHPITIFQLKSFPRIKNCKCLIDLVISKHTLNKITDMKLNKINLKCQPDQVIDFLRQNSQLKEFHINNYWLLDGVYYTHNFSYIPENAQKLYIDSHNITSFIHYVRNNESVEFKHVIFKEKNLFISLNCFQVVEIETNYFTQLIYPFYNEKFKYIIKLYYNHLIIKNNLKHIIRHWPAENLKEIKIDLSSTIKYLQSEIKKKQKELFHLSDSKWIIGNDNKDYDEIYTQYIQLSEELSKCMDIFKKYKKLYHHLNDISFIKPCKYQKYYEFDII